MSLLGIKSTVFIHRFLLNSDKNLYFNISVPYFRYKGDEMRSCLFGGITFFSVNLKELNELKTMCGTSITHSRNLQNLHSNMKQILVVIYAYQGYSSIHVRLRLSFSKCVSARINVCISNQKRDGHWLYNTGPLKGVIYAYRSLANIIVILNDIECIVVQLYKGQTTSNIRCSKTIRIEKSIGNPQTYQYHINGYFSSDYRFTNVRQMVSNGGGEHFQHDIQKDVSLQRVSGGKSTVLKLSEYKHIYTPQRHCLKPSSEITVQKCHFYDLTHSNRKNWDLKFALIFYTLIPIRKLPLFFDFITVAESDWIDIFFGPNRLQTKMDFISGLAVLIGDQVKQHVRIKREEIMIIEYNLPRNTSKQLNLEINITMKVSIYISQ